MNISQERRNFRLTLKLFLFSFFVIGLSCDSPTVSKEKQDVKQIFTKISASDSGVDFKNSLIDDPLDPRKNVMDFPNYFNGGGTAIADFDNDGLADIFFVGNEVENKIYKNLGDLKFENKTSTANVNTKKAWSNGVTVVDINNDGFQDIYVCQSNTKLEHATAAPNLLYINNGDFTFSEQAEKYGLDNRDLTHQASFFDYDQDGDLDCFLLNTSIYVRVQLKDVFAHLEADKNNLKAASCKLYENQGGKFVDITEKAGMLKYGYGLGLVVSDLNEDGLTDIYVANDYSTPDLMYINNGDGTFTDKIKETTNQISFYAMGADIADINNDGHLDIGVVDMAADDHIRDKTLMASMNIPEFKTYVNYLKYQHQYMFNSMQLNNGNGTYSNIANLAGMAKTDWSWALLFGDFNNDGYKDYFVSNGYKRYARDNDSRIRLAEYRKSSPNNSVPKEFRKELYSQLPSMKLKNIMLMNNKDLTFTKVTDDWGLGDPTFSNGASYGDLDNDGDLDLVINNLEDFASIYRNNSNGNYLGIDLSPSAKVKNVENTKITIKYGDEIQFLEYTPTRGFLSSVETNSLHFGLGEVDKIDYLQVNWPNGQINYLSNVDANQILKLSPSMKNSGSMKDLKNKALALFKEQNQNNKIAFIHKENEYDDFKKEILLPHKQSSLGPKISVSDLNGDGLDDLFIGNAKDLAGSLYIQNSSGNFRPGSPQVFLNDKSFEDLNSHFFDYDGDGDQDLYVCSGGGGDFGIGSALLADRLYENDGSGNFTKTINVIPNMRSVSSVAKSYDFDQDGDLDLFVGGRGVPGKYPYAERSYLLKNEGGKFTDVTKEINEDLLKPGLVTDALWADMTGDGLDDLVIVGEWMNVSVYKNEKSKLTDISKSLGIDEYRGWWYSVAAADIDNDGDLDLICGNNSPNTKFKASKKKPFNVFADDFDNNGSCDIVLSKEYNGKLVPTRGKQCSTEQMPFIKEKFPTYNGFANASVQDILGDKINAALHLKVTDFHSMVFINDGGSFKAKKLPNEAQVAPINGIIPTDLNKDGNIDLIIAGNNFDTEVETARYDAGTGLALIGDGKGDFKAMACSESGIFANKNVKDIKMIQNEKGESLILVANNNGPMQIFQANNEGSEMIGSLQ